MKRTRIPALVVTVLLIALSAAVVMAIDPVGAPAASDGPRTPVAPGSADPGPLESEPPFAELNPRPVTRGPSFDTTLAEGYPTGDGTQSKLWVHNGIWFGVLIAEGTNEFRIHRLDWASQTWLDTGVPVADRTTVHPDVLSEGDRVWIATGGGDDRGSRRIASLFRYSYDPDLERYTLDADFPVVIAREQPHSLTLARDAGGRLWAAWINDGQLTVNRTDGNDVQWGEPYVPPVPGTVVQIDAVATTRYGDTVAVLWSNQNRDAFYLAVPRVDEEERWDLYETVVEGLAHADDHVSATVVSTPAGPRLYAVIKTSLDELEFRNPDDPQVLLLVREPDGTWYQYLYGRIRDRHTRPVLILDEQHRILYVLATSPFGGGTIYYKATSMDDISFTPGKGTPLLVHPALPAINSATVTKQHLDGSTGLVVLASDSQTGRYAHVAAGLDGEAQLDVTVPEAAPPPRWLVRDTFDPYPAGVPLPDAWSLRQPGSTTFAVADVDGRRVAAATGAGDGSDVRMCRSFVPVGVGDLTVEVEFWFSGAPASDGTVTSVRHDGQESAVVRISDRGVFSFFDGPDHVRSEVPYAAGTWYRSTVTVDLATRTYAWEVRRSADDAVVMQVADLPWRRDITSAADEVCIETPTWSAPGSVLAVDHVRVGP